MTTDNNRERMETIYRHLWSPGAAQLLAQLDKSLNPRSSEMLYAIVKELGINRGHTVLDAGSGLGIYSCGLASKFGCHVVGIDIAENNLEMARARTREERVDKFVTFQQGNIQSLPFDDAAFDLVWCRDMLVHVRDLQQAFSEFARVLKPNGTVLIHTTFATNLMEPKEEIRLYEPLGIVPPNTYPPYFEDAIKAACLQIYSSEPIDSEWLEYSEEQQGRPSKELLHIARMRRLKERIVAEFGQEAYDVILAVDLWHIYLLIGKLSSTIYTLRKSA
jgi:2-polyprenyl-3-methyl-5-hydroxy-6-metoxy-1,4-benzoquinol methylase